MAAMRPDGTPAEIPMGQRRQRGRNLAEDEVRRVRDLFFVVATEVMGLSVPDAVRVFAAGDLTPRQVYARLRACPLGRRDVVAALVARRGRGASHRAG